MSFKKEVIYSILLNILSKGLYFVFFWGIGYIYSINALTDIFFFLLNNLIAFLGIINFFTTDVILPNVFKIEEEYGKQIKVEYLSMIYKYYFILGLVLALLFAVLPVSVISYTTGFKYEDIIENLILIKLFSIVIFILIISNFQVIIFLSFKENTLSVAITAFINLIAVFLLFIFRTNIIPTLSLLIAYGAVTIIFFFYQWKKKGIKIWGTKSQYKQVDLFDNLKLFFKVFSIYISSFVLNFTLLRILSTYKLGLVTYYNLGLQISSIPIQLFLMQYVSVLGLKLNEFSAFDKRLDAENLIYKSFKYLLILLFPFCFWFLLVFDDIGLILLDFKRLSYLQNENFIFFARCLIFLVPYQVFNNIFARYVAAFSLLNRASYLPIFHNILLLILVTIVSKLYDVKIFMVIYVCAMNLYIIFIYFFIKMYVSQELITKIGFYLLKLTLTNVILYILCSVLLIEIYTKELFIFAGLLVFYIINYLLFYFSSSK